MCLRVGCELGWLLAPVSYGAAKVSYGAAKPDLLQIFIYY